MRIASLQPSITIALKHLGRLDTLCAVTKYCLEALPELAALNLPILHDSWTADTAEILATNPTLVLASVPYRLESLADILKTGLPVLALAPHSLANIYADTRLIASLVDARLQAESLIAHMQHQIAAAAITTASIAPKSLVHCEEWGKPLIHSQLWVAELVQAAGGRFLGEPGSRTSPEAVAAADPDVLLFAWCGAGDRVPLGKLVAQRSWQHLKAVRRGSVHCIPDEYLNTPAVTLLEGLACIAHALHPALFPPHPRHDHLAGDFNPNLARDLAGNLAQNTAGNIVRALDKIRSQDAAFSSLPPGTTRLRYRLGLLKYPIKVSVLKTLDQK